MERFSVQDEGAKRASGLKALFVEIGIIALLSVIILIVLAYFGVINFFGFFPGKSKENDASSLRSSPQLEKSTSNPTNRNEYLARLKKNGAVVSSETTTEYVGKVKNIDLDGGEFYDKWKNQKFDYEIMIVLIGGEDDALLNYYFPKGSASKIKVIDGPTGKPLNIFELKSGINVTMKVTLSNLVSYPDYLVEAIITRN